MSNFTNEVPENMDEIIQRLRLYINKSYNKPDKSMIQRIVSNFNLSLTKTGKWGNRWGYAEANAIITIPTDVFDIVNDNVNKNLRIAIDKVLQSTDCGLEIISLEFVPGNISQIEDDVPELEVLFEEQKNKIIKEITRNFINSKYCPCRFWNNNLFSMWHMFFTCNIIIGINRVWEKFIIFYNTICSIII